MYKSLLGMFVIFASIAESGSPFTGVWEASLNDQPAIELTINEMDGKIGGTIVFYFQRRGDDGKWRVEGGRNPTPLLMPVVKGKSLTFEVIHHKHHGSTERGPNAKFRVDLTDHDSLALFKTDEVSDGGPGLKLTRKK